jgi:hypothetical protein
MYIDGPLKNFLTEYTLQDYACVGCGNSCGVFKSTFGIFDDGSGRSSSYARNAACEWILAPPGAKVILLTFTEFSTEPGFDKVTVYQCSSIYCKNPIFLDQFSGSIPIGTSVVSNTSYMKVLFTSNGVQQYPGFTATWVSGCPKGTYANETGKYLSGNLFSN